MPLPIAAAIIGGALIAGSAANKYFTGKKQGNQAKGLRNQSRPFDRPEQEFFTNQALARTQISQGLPGADRMRARNNQIVSGTAYNSSKYGASPAQILAAISQASGRGMDAEADIGAEGAKYRANAVTNLQAQNTALGERKRKAWEYNYAKPYDEDMAAASALEQAAMANKQNALDTLTKIPLLFAK